MREIELHFNDKSKPALSGDSKGEEAFKEQVAPFITEEDYKKGFVIVFPQHIEMIGSSFMQGFSREMIKKIGYQGVVSKIVFKTQNESMSQELYDDLV